MAVVFESIVKSDGEGGWCIDLLDTLDERKCTCKDLQEYEKKIQEFGQKYGGHIDEVRWSQEDDLPPAILDQVRLAMSEYQEKYKDEINEQK